MSFLLDTNVLSELRRGERASAGVLSWFEGTRDEGLFTSVLVLGELRRGVESVRRRDPIAASALEQWLARLEEQFAARILVARSLPQSAPSGSEAGLGLCYLWCPPGGSSDHGHRRVLRRGLRPV